MENYDGEACYASLRDLPKKLGSIYNRICRKKTEEIVKKAKNLGISG
jgi:ribosomal protein L32E